MQSGLSYLDSIDRLLGELPQITDINKMQKFPINRTYRIRVERTMPFEWISRWMPPFFGLWGTYPSFEYSDYDAALTQADRDISADAIILWIDWRLYQDSMTAEHAADWLKERIESITSRAGLPILVNNWPVLMDEFEILFGTQVGKRKWAREFNIHLANRIHQMPNCSIIDLAALSHTVNDHFYDRRNDQIGRYPFSSKASVAIARHLGVHLFPALFIPRIKAIALDMDDTLYAGTLGEDGIEGVRLSDDHAMLQQLLLKLKQSGILLTLCSRNMEDDARELFEQRADFPLKWNDFAAVSVNWQPKPENIIHLAAKLNIDPSAILFVDDNPAELLNMLRSLPSVPCLRASEKANETVTKLCHFPGLYLLREDAMATLRTADIQANQIREKLKSSASDPNAYLESLNMVITLYVNCSQHANRLYDLSRKTNQFNLALRRMSEAEAVKALTSDDFFTVTVGLRDYLTDSGIIGAIVGRVDKDEAIVNEVLFSCRALGRDVETIAFAFFLQCLLKKGIQQVTVSVADGPKNEPARDWLTRHINDAAVRLPVKELLSRISASCAHHPAKLEVVPNERS